MSKILAIDYGLKRCGVAITDDIKMLATPLTTVMENELLDFVVKQVEQNKVDEIVVGLPSNLKGESTDATAHVNKFFEVLKAKHPTLTLALHDERFTSLLAQKSIHTMQTGKKKRETKGLLDKVSAAVLLQSYIEHKSFRQKNNI